MQTKSQQSIDASPQGSDTRLDELRERLLSHEIYQAVDGIESLRCFMEAHVFAVWDFMSLTKRLQREVTCVEVPWMPPASSTSARFINEIVLAEESDIDARGQARSHLELYLEAMEDVGASTRLFQSFLGRLRQSRTVQDAVSHCGLADHVAQFVTQTTGVALHGKTHEVASTFLHGREDLIPEMFQRLLEGPFFRSDPCEHFRYYLDRHILIDSEEHGPAASALVDELIGEDSNRAIESRTAAEHAIEARLALWDGVVATLP